jgi:hypothetical protein
MRWWYDGRVLTKYCRGCQRDRPRSSFYRDASASDGLQSRCRDCHHVQKEKWRRSDRGRASISDHQRRYRQTEHGKRTRAAALSRFHERHPEKRSQYFDRHRAYYVDYERRRYRDDPQYRLARVMRVAVRRSLTGGTKRRRPTFELLGYTAEALEARLRATLPAGFTWDDFTAGRLEIDHIVPITAFCFSSPEHPDFARCWALSNLQLLPKPENRRKKDRAPLHFQPLLPMHIATLVEPSSRTKVRLA